MSIYIIEFLSETNNWESWSEKCLYREEKVLTS